jgi:protein-tyrosine phosphatase
MNNHNLTTTIEPNLHFVTDTLAIGGDLDTDRPHVALGQLEAVKDLGITHIVDCRLEWSDEDFVAQHAPGILYLHNPTDDDGRSRPENFFERGVEFALAAMDNPDAKVLVHCHMGINRAPSLGLAVLMQLGIDPVEAIAMIRRARPIAAVGYATDALDWHLRRDGTNYNEAAAQRRRLVEWLDDNPVDVVRIIRQIRAGTYAEPNTNGGLA